MHSVGNDFTSSNGAIALFIIIFRIRAIISRGKLSADDRSSKRIGTVS